jgi:hypothetical protein
MLELVKSDASAEPLREQLREAEARGVIECYEPATRKSLGSVAVTAPEQIPQLVARAR